MSRPNRLLTLLACCLVCLSSRQCRKADSGKVLNVYIWSDYLPQAVVDDFTARTGIKVNVSLFSTNEELLDKLQSGVADYDVVVPSDYMVKRLAAKGLVRPLDRTKLPNFQNLDPKFLDQKFDPGNKVSFPYFWGTTGIGYAKDAAPAGVDSWAALFDPQYKGKILMLNDGRECFAVALMSMGKSPNETDPAALKAAADKLKGQKPLVKVYDSDAFADKLSAGDVGLAHGYNGQLAKAVAASDGKLAFAVPKEGATFWMDNLCVPTAARHAENAYAFLNYVLEPAVAAKIADGVAYATPNAAARPHVNPDLLKDPAIYPPDDVLKRCVFLEEKGEAAELVNRYWTEIKAE